MQKGEVASVAYALAGVAWLAAAGSGQLVDLPSASLFTAILFTLTALGGIVLTGPRGSRFALAMLALGCVSAVLAMPAANRQRRARAEARATHAVSQVVGKPAPALEWVAAVKLDPDTAAALGAADGRWQLIELAAPWTTPGLEQMRALSERARLVDRQRLVVVGVVPLRGREQERDAEIAGLEEYAERFLISYPLLLAADDRNQHALGVTSVPAVVINDPHGRVGDVFTGPGALDRALARLEDAGAL